MNTDALSWAEPAPSLARSVAGEFRLVREIGRGGMGVVYLAEDTQLHRRVAIKTLPPHLAADPQVRERFLREARTAAGLSHPNIVPIFAAAERDGVVYFVMGYVDGVSLAERLQRDGPLSLPETLPIARQLAEALRVAHAAGVVHRDIKAENVLLDGAGRALVTDFGIARLSEAQPLTATGTVLGTVQYMSPEQVTGDALDGRSDLYALGVLLFHLLTGRFPFERPTASAVLVAHVNSAPARLRDFLPQVPDAWDALVQALLAKRASDRVPSAAALLTWLDALARGEAGPPVAVAIRPEVSAPSSSSPVDPDAPLSSVDAQAVWARAAELQAYTGALVPPATFPAPVTGEPVTRGYDATLVKAAAAEAGIDARYVERALAERVSAGQRGAEMVVRAGQVMHQAPNRFVGAPTRLDFEAVVEGELSLEAFEDIADIARRSLGDLVTVSAVGRTLTINTNIPRSNQASSSRMMQLTVAVRNGRTTIRAYEDLSQTVAGLFAGFGLGAGMGLGALFMGLLTKFQGPAVGMATWGATLVATFGLARLLYGRSVAKKQVELRELVSELARFAGQRVLRSGGTSRQG